MKGPAHVALQRVIDQLVLLHAGLAAELLGFHRGGPVVAVPGQVANLDIGIRESRLDPALDFAGIHGHEATPC
ncbi:hypothetical protein D3C72_2251150 [compost metagenome]